jgi:hypothetical protein
VTGMVATNDFSGLVSSDWALARAPAMAPIDSLERCTRLGTFEQPPNRLHWASSRLVELRQGQKDRTVG